MQDHDGVQSVKEQAMDPVACDGPDETGWHTLAVAADYYERSWRIRIELNKLQRGDWWIAFGLYLSMVTVTFLML